MPVLDEDDQPMLDNQGKAMFRTVTDPREIVVWTIPFSFWRISWQQAGV